jgi:hypothetical protein
LTTFIGLKVRSFLRVYCKLGSQGPEDIATVRTEFLHCWRGDNR